MDNNVLNIFFISNCRFKNHINFFQTFVIMKNINFSNLNTDQLEILIRILDYKYNSYFTNPETALDSFSWCFASKGRKMYLVNSDFNSLLGRIRFDAKIIATQLLLDADQNLTSISFSSSEP